MAVDGINYYQGTNGVTGMSTGKSNNSLDMNDFLSLLVAQLSNQDMYNTMDDTQFMQQMAQFSMVQALSDMSQMSQTAYSVSLIGKEATVAEMNQDGTLNAYTGIVEGVKLYNGGSVITIEGKDFPLSSVMEVKEPKIIIPTQPKEPDPPEDKPEEPGGNDDGNNDGGDGGND